MKKIPTIFFRDETKKGHPVMDKIKPECEWVIKGEGIATGKLDGTNVKIQDGELFKRRKPKSGEYTEASYVPCRRDDPSDKYAFEAFDLFSKKLDGIYELIGPKIQGNPHNTGIHRMIRVVPPEKILIFGKEDFDRSFDGLKIAALRNYFYEGIVFHHPDGRFAKIKRRDFGLKWPDEVGEG